MTFAHYLFCATALVAAAPTFATTLFGPVPYKSFADSPFNGIEPPVFYVETFEDDLFNTPGIFGQALRDGASLAIGQPGTFTDSVDGDDGNSTDGGQFGHSLTAVPNIDAEADGFGFEFDPGTLGGLPTHVGIVWTDGSPFASVIVEFFAPGGGSVGSVGPSDIGDDSFAGTTGEDHFFGIIHDDGIESFRIYAPGSTNNLEVDHIQYGLIPEPTSAAALSLAMLWLTRRRIG